VGSGGLTQNIVATGIENGLQYIDYRLSGTATGNAEIRLEGNTIAASNGQVWTSSAYLKTISGAPNSTRLVIIERTSGGAYIVDGSTGSLAVDSTLKQFTFTRTLAGGVTVALVQPLIFFFLTAGTTYDFTIRIAAPQMELGSYATTFIPTTTAAVTRLADVATHLNASDLIGQTAGVLFVDINLPNTTDSVRQLQVSDGNLNNRIQIATNGTNITPAIASGGVIQATFTIPYTAGNHKIAIAYANNDVVLYVNGALVGTDTSATIPTCSRIDVGNSIGTNQAGHGITQAALYTTRLSNSELQALTTL
jgi:hypothetical protein